MLLPVCNAFEFKFFVKIVTVDKQPKTMEWQNSNRLATIDNSNRYIKGGMVSILSIFTKMYHIKTFHVQVDSIVALSHIVKVKGATSDDLA